MKNLEVMCVHMLRGIVETKGCMNSTSITYNVILVYLPVAWYSEMVSVTGAVRGNCSFFSVNNNYCCVKRQLLLGVKRLLLLGAQVAGYGCYS